METQVSAAITMFFVVATFVLPAIALVWALGPMFLVPVLSLVAVAATVGAWGDLAVKIQEMHPNDRAFPFFDPLNAPFTTSIAVGAVAGAWTLTALAVGADLSTDENFYTSAAQVLPVLVLTFSVETGLFRLVPQPTESGLPDRPDAFFFVLVLSALAEVVTFIALGSSSLAVDTAATVLGAIAIPAALALAVASPFFEVRRVREAGRRRDVAELGQPDAENAEG